MSANEYDTYKRLWKMLFPQFSEYHGTGLVQELLGHDGYVHPDSKTKPEKVFPPNFRLSFNHTISPQFKA